MKSSRDRPRIGPEGSVGGIVPCGGGSRRMGGRPKALLRIGPETMLQRVVRIVASVVAPVVVVRGRSADVGNPPGVLLAEDRVPDRGPLEGLAVGLGVLAQRNVEWAMVVACDLPLLRPALIRHLLQLAEGFDAVVPEVLGRVHPLCAVYRTDLHAMIDRLLDSDGDRPRHLLEEIHVRWVTSEELTPVDADLSSLFNVNTPADHAVALARLGFS